MPHAPPDLKRFLAAAKRNLRALRKEKETHGFYDDGGGKRYRVGVYFVLAGKTDDALDYFRWYESEFPDDCGEPLMFLFWALAELRAGHPDAACARLAQAMAGNLRLVPNLLGQPVPHEDAKVHSSRPYLDDSGFLDEYRPAFCPGELEWICATYDSPALKDIRKIRRSCPSQ